MLLGSLFHFLGFKPIRYFFLKNEQLRVILWEAHSPVTILPFSWCYFCKDVTEKDGHLVYVFGCRIRTFFATFVYTVSLADGI